jgi:hypothetical protein
MRQDKLIKLISFLGLGLLVVGLLLFYSQKTTPTPPVVEEEEIFCGGIMGRTCPPEFKCMLDGDYPDAGGKCVR